MYKDQNQNHCLKIGQASATDVDEVNISKDKIKFDYKYIQYTLEMRHMKWKHAMRMKKSDLGMKMAQTCPPAINFVDTLQFP